MKKTRYIVLPITSRQYVVLFIISLACFTFGIISRDQERRYGNFIRSELRHTNLYEVDFANDDHISYLLSSFLSFTKLASAVPSTMIISSKNKDSSKLINSTWINHKSHLNSRHYYKTHSIKYQMSLFTKYRKIDKQQDRQIKSLKNRNIHIRWRLKEHVVLTLNKSYTEHNIKNSQFNKFIRKYTKDRKSVIYDLQVDMYKYRFNEDLHNDYFKLGLSFSDLEFQNRQNIKKNLIYKPLIKNEPNYFIYRNSKKDYHEYHENRFNSRENNKIITEEKRLNSNKNRSVNQKNQLFDIQNRLDSSIKNQHIMENKILNLKIKRQNNGLRDKHKLVGQTFVRNEIKYQRTYKTKFIVRYYIRGEMSRLKNQKSSKNIDNKDNIEENARLSNRVIPKNSIYFKVGSRNIKIIKYNIEYSKNHRGISESKNYHLLAMNQSYEENNRPVNNRMQTFPERNHRTLFSRQETIRQIYENRFHIDVNIIPRTKQKSSKIINKIQLQNDYFEIRRDIRYTLVLKIREKESKNHLTIYHDWEFFSRKLKSVSVENLQHKTNSENQRATNFPSQYQIYVNKLDKIKNEKHIERYRSMHIENVNLKKNFVRLIKIKTTSMVSQYLKFIIKSINLDYTILRQAFIIVFCAIYSTSILKSKSQLIGNPGKYINSISIL